MQATVLVMQNISILCVVTASDVLISSILSAPLFSHLDFGN